MKMYCYTKSSALGGVISAIKVSRDGATLNKTPYTVIQKCGLWRLDFFGN